MTITRTIEKTPSWLRPLGFTAVIVILCTSLIIPFWRFEFIPFMDLPQHVAEAAIDAYHDLPVAGFGAYYEINESFHPYYAYRKIQVWLTHLTFPEAATKILLSITVAAFPLSCLLLLAALKRDKWLVILCFPPAWNYMLFMGYTAYCLSVPLYFMAMAFLLWPPESRLPELIRVLGAFVCAALSWLMHAQTFVFLFASTLICLPLVFPYRTAVLRALPIGAVLLLFYIFSESLVDDAGQTVHAEYTPLWPKTRAILSIMNVYQSHSDEWVFYLWLAMTFAIILMHPPSLRGPDGRITQKQLRDYVPEVLLVILMIFFWALPFSLLGKRHVVHVAERLLCFYPPLMVLCAGPGKLKSTLARIFLVVGFGLCIFQGVDANLKFAAFQKEARGFTEVVNAIPVNSKVMSIVVTQRSQVVNLLPFMHFGAYVQVRRGGLHSFSFAGINEIGIKYKPGNPAADLPENWEWKPGRYFRYEVHGYDWDYFLVFYLDKENPAQSIIEKGYVKLVAHKGSWFLYKNVGRDKLPKVRPTLDRKLYEEPVQAVPVPGTG